MSFVCWFAFAQEGKTKEDKPKGHINNNKFKQLHYEWATPNDQHLASGQAGPAYTQQKVDYNMNIVLDDENAKLSGNERIVYHNNSKDHLEYLWLQLDQNKRAKDSKSKDIEGQGPEVLYSPEKFASEFIEKPFDGGFKLPKLQMLKESLFLILSIVP